MRVSTLVATIASAALLAAMPAQAITVFDPTNYAQNILQASRALEQIHNQIQTIEQQAQMLARNPLQLSPELTQSIAEGRQLLSAAQGLSFQMDQMNAQVRTLYPTTWSNFNLGEVSAQSDQWLAEDRRSLETAMQAEAQAAQAMDATQGRLDRALQSSTNAQGQTGALQASNQLLGVQSAQLAQIQTLLAAESRALSEERMERLAREERAQEILRSAFPTQTSSAPAPARSAFEH